jgi:hypothetical protein
MLPCPTCGANIEARNEALGIAACGQCGGLFEWPLLPSPVARIDPAERVNVEFREGMVRAIHYRANPSVMWGSVAIVVASTVAVSYFKTGIELLALLLLIVVGIVMVLSDTSRRVGGIHLRLGPVISIRNGIAGRRHFAAASLRQPFVQGASGSYDLCAIQADGTVVTLAGGFQSRIDAWSVERELEAALGIADAPVPGELNRRDPIVVDTAAPLRAVRLVCPACSAPLTARDVQLRKGQAMCPGCRKGIQLGGRAAPGPRTLVVLPPPRALVDRSRSAFALEAGLGTGEPRAIWRTALYVAIFGAYLGLLVAAGKFATLIISFVFIGMWAKLCWLLLVRQWNRVRIRVENGTLHVRVGPVPPRTHRSIDVSKIEQVFVRAQPETFFTRWFPTGGDGYQLCAFDRLSANEHLVIPLVDRMIDLREARYLEEQIEQFLGIADAPVAGEVEGKMLRHEAGVPSHPGSGNLSLPDAAPGGEISVPRAAGALSDPE